MFEQPRWSLWAGLSLIAGIYWIVQAMSVGFFTSLPLWLVGGGLLACGVSQLHWPGDTRATQTGALIGALGVVVAIPSFFVVGIFGGFCLIVTALTGAWGAGRMALQLEPHHDGVPVPRPTLPLAAKVAADELILGIEQFQTTGFPLDGTIERVIDEVDRCHALFAREGWLEKPDAYHVMPPDLVDPEIRTQQIGGHSVEILRFESGYAPTQGEPGRERWLGYDGCRDGWAYVLRHEGPPRPWLIATNGYRMGHARLDVGLFERFHKESGKGSAGLGLNVLIPVLPLHGPRRLGWQSGSGFLGIDVIDTLHAESQSIWDMRRLLSWIRTQDSEAVGAFGLSLGGYTTAIFASIADGLSCAVPGIPVANVAGILERHGSPHQLRYARSRGFDFDRVEEMLRVVSPLALSPRVPLEGRMIFAANADRLVPPDQVRDLWRHWEEPEIVWYEGAHVSFMNEREVWAGVDRTMRENGLSV
jgi:dienelactone hydrolase